MCKQFCDNVNTMCFAGNIPTDVQRKIFKFYFLNTLSIKTKFFRNTQNGFGEPTQ